MAIERISQWVDAHTVMNIPKMPLNVIYYRDGVAEGTSNSNKLIFEHLADTTGPIGQYSKVKTVEVSAIREAWDIVKKTKGVAIGTLRLTAVVGGKRHHTRFYPNNSR